MAQEEGRNLVKLKGDEGSSTRHYTLTFVKQGNRWRYLRVREELETGISHHQRLEELAWLVGEWTDESPDSLVHTTCRWTEDGNFLLRDFTVRVQGKSVMTVHERIGWDPSKRQVVSWCSTPKGATGRGLEPRCQCVGHQVVRGPARWQDRPLADAGDDAAELWLARWLADCDRLDVELRECAGTGGYHATHELARLLADHDLLDELRDRALPALAITPCVSWPGDSSSVTCPRSFGNSSRQPMLTRGR